MRSFADPQDEELKLPTEYPFPEAIRRYGQRLASYIQWLTVALIVLAVFFALAYMPILLLLLPFAIFVLLFFVRRDASNSFVYSEWSSQHPAFEVVRSEDYGIGIPCGLIATFVFVLLIGVALFGPETIVGIAARLSQILADIGQKLRGVY